VVFHKNTVFLQEFFYNTYLDFHNIPSPTVILIKFFIKNTANNI